jgi:hypothetical protein
MSRHDPQNGVLPTYSRGYEVQLVLMSENGRARYRTVAERGTLDGARVELGRLVSQMRNKFTRGRTLVQNHEHRNVPVRAVRILSRSEPESHNPLAQINLS